MKLRCNLGVYLLVLVIEECAEVIQRACKAIRFGLEEKQNTPSGESQQNNAERLYGELTDLKAVRKMAADHGVIPAESPSDVLPVATKQAKVRKYMAYSRECGTLIQETEDDGR